MDAYLESLVKKGEEVKEEVVEEVSAEVKPEVEEVEPIDEVVEEMKEVEIETSSVDPEEYTEIIEEAEQQEAQKEESPAEKEVKEEKVKEEPKKESPKKTATPESRKDYTEEETIPVKDIKIFNTPDSGSPYKIYSGNVIYKGRIASFAAIDYMKPGFGLVKGFTQDIF